MILKLMSDEWATLRKLTAVNYLCDTETNNKITVENSTEIEKGLMINLKYIYYN